MRYIKNVALLVAAVFFLCGFGGGSGGGGGGGGSPTGSAGGDLGGTYPNPTVGSVAHVNTGTLPAANGGTGNALQYVINDRGSTASPACDFSLGYICRFATTANATLTASNIPGTTTAPVMVQVLAYTSGANNTLTFPSSFRGGVAGGVNPGTSPTYDIFQGGGGNVVYDVFSAYCDGTTCTLFTTGQNIAFSSVTTTQIKLGGGVLTGSSTSITIGSGLTFQSTGGAIPTATCSGGSTGVVVESNAGCTGSTAPFPCCTGSGTGTCFSSTNNRGALISSSSASTTCTLTFSAAGTWNQAPACIWQSDNASVAGLADGTTTTTTAVVNFTSGTSKIMDYICM